MKFTGINLERVREGITLALAELRNQIGTCPDVNAYARELQELDQEVEYYEQLLAKIDVNLEKEKRAIEAGGRPLTPNQYYGKVCPKHPELKGLRGKPSYRCTKCVSEYQSLFNKRKRLDKKVEAECKR